LAEGGIPKQHSETLDAQLSRNPCFTIEIKKIGFRFSPQVSPASSRAAEFSFPPQSSILVEPFLAYETSSKSLKITSNEIATSSYRPSD
jgi:hypothetical protein